MQDVFLSLKQKYDVTNNTTAYEKHRKNCKRCPHHSLFMGHNAIVHIVVLKCQGSGHKFLGLLCRKSEISQKIYFFKSENFLKI